MTIDSKLPHVGNSIFSEMTALAQQHQAINLSQGFPDYDIDPYLIELASKSMHSGYNQYAPMPGLITLRERIAAKYQDFYGVYIDPHTEITITAGATQAIFTTIATLIRPGDEVIIFEPAYDCYRPSVELFGGRAVPIRLYAPEFKIDWDEVENRINEKTKLIIINNPGNPTCTTLSKEDLLQLERLIQNNAIFVLSDEVYEHLVYDGTKHQSMALYPALKARSFIAVSFGKLLHCTGWKSGYVIAPPSLTAEFRKIHQFNVFCINTPIQHAIAKYVETPNYYAELSTFFQQKRDFVLRELQSSRFHVHPNQGTYFLLLNYEKLSEKNELDYAIELIEQHGIALIPISAFYSNKTEQKTLRLCFAKKDETLDRAISILKGI